MNLTVLPDSILSPLCKPFSKQADWLLELYEMTQRPNHSAGRCLKCFYALLESADSRKAPALEPLKSWIEDNVELELKEGDQTKCPRPVRLESKDFESFCTETIESVRRDESIQGEIVQMHLRFKASEAA